METIKALAAKSARAPPGWPSAFFGLLPHEVFFGLFLSVTWVRLTLAEGLLSGDALLYLGLMAANLWACWCYRSQDTPVRCRLGLLFYPIAMNIVFAHRRSAVPKIHPQRMDGWLEHIDARLVGTNLSLRQGFDHGLAAMSVVVQEMILCDVAGVGFSINPVSGDPFINQWWSCFYQFDRRSAT